MPRAPKNVAKGDATREAIFEAAIDNFGRFGYRGASLARIAEQCGIVQSAILHHFGSKEKLLLATLDRYYDSKGTLQTPDGRGLDDIPVFDYLQLVAQINEGRERLVRFYAVMSGESLTEGHPATPFFQRRFNDVRTDLAARLLRSHESLDAERALAIVTLAVAALDGLQIQWILDRHTAMGRVFAVLDELLAPRLR